nr:hypothetical protein [Deinococcus sp. S9]
MDEEPDDEFEAGLVATEGETFSHQERQVGTEGGIEAFDVLGSTNPMQSSKNHPLVGRQAVWMTDRVQVGCGKALTQAKGAWRVVLPKKAADDSPRCSVYRQPDPEPTVLTTDERAQLIAFQHQRGWCWNAQAFFAGDCSSSEAGTKNG